MEGNLLVSPEKLEATASNFDALHGKVSNTISEMMDTVLGLASGWEGDAASEYIYKFKSLDSDMTQLRNMIKEHVADLREMAQVYRKAENENTTSSNALPIDSIT